jgi:hypothetical protein
MSQGIEVNLDKMSQDKELFLQLKDKILSLDPIYFIEKYLTLDGKPFRLNGNGYKPLADIYRYIGVKSLEPNAKPTIIVKGRQIGATTMASALEIYFMCSHFGKNGKAPARVVHTFPLLDQAAAYSKTKLSQIINQAIVTDPDPKNPKQKNCIQNMMDHSSATNDSLHFKQFLNGNHLWLESLGLTGNRLIGKTADILFIDEYQSSAEEAVGNSLKILTTAKYGKKSKGGAFDSTQSLAIFVSFACSLIYVIGANGFVILEFEIIESSTSTTVLSKSLHSHILHSTEAIIPLL